ncbi:hypothetical protein OCAE111667_06460 [Occultella aeris]|uniref:Uncharacterized protein n=1 Tax=Occultella aeris TaxID=2761496 RepID=A0A7M4DS04_9MICO|nr:hypothetical protein [Occultella aeris]VZO40248.1 hypothetical protein HALOF300_04951 [Occultella aeris]
MRRILPVAAASTALLLLTSACSAASGDGDDLAVGTSVEVSAGEAASLAVTVTDVRAGTVEDLSTMGVDASSLAGRVPWFVTVTMGLTEGTIQDVDRDLMPSLAPDQWSGEVSNGADAQPLQVIGDYDCTVDGSANAGFTDDEPLVDCVALLTADSAELESVTLMDVGTWVVAAG